MYQPHLLGQKGATGATGPAGPAGPTGPAGPAGADCCTPIPDNATLTALWPPVAGVHTVAANGCYCFGSFALTAGNRIQVPAGIYCRFTGAGPASELEGSVLAPVISLAATSRFYCDNLKIRQLLAHDCLFCATTECYLIQMAMFANDVGDGLNVSTSSKADLTQVRITNAVRGIQMSGGEVYAQGLDVETVDMVLEVTGNSDVIQVENIRANNVTGGAAFVQNGGNVSTSFTTRNARANSLTTWFFRNAGTIAPYVDISGIKATNLTNQLFNPNAQVPASMTCIYRNSVNGPAPTLFAGGFTTGSANARVRANSVNNVLQAEV